MRHADSDLGCFAVIGQIGEALAEDREQSLAIDTVVRQHRFAAQQIAPIDIANVATQRFAVVLHDPLRLAGIEHAGRGRTSGDAGNYLRLDRELGRGDLPEPRLPPAAVAAAGEYDLVKHWQGSL